MCSTLRVKIYIILNHLGIKDFFFFYSAYGLCELANIKHTVNIETFMIPEVKVLFKCKNLVAEVLPNY